LNLLNHTDFGW